MSKSHSPVSQVRLLRALLFVSGFVVSVALASAADPRITSWYTRESGKYARLYSNDAAKSTGTTVTTWTNGTQVQSSPAYVGVQEVAYSASWVYIRSSGLAAHVMGPWYLNAAHTNTFPNLPKNSKTIYRIPRAPTVPTAKTLTGLGAIGYFADGVAMFDSRDGFVWTGSAESGNGTGYWNRDAYVNESVTFDPAYAHQEQSGTYHYHANPIALRYKLGDHIDFNASTKTYSESAAPVTRHSPILGWSRDGYPVYGPYGYSVANNEASGVRRMISGYQLRNGQNGADNLSTTRPTIPAWAQRLYGVSATQTGPSVNTTYPLGRYMEDNAYLGDLGKTKGVDFDLDEYNGRDCVTPEFPGGTYAYFVAIDANGAPKFPYNIGRAFYGNPTGSSVSAIAETVVTAFKGGPDTQETMNPPVLVSGNVSVGWNSVEGASYKLEAVNDLQTTWSVVSASVSANAGTTTQFPEAGGATGRSQRFYRVTRTAIAAYDKAAPSTGILSVQPNSGSPGQSFTLTVNLDPSATPAPPPQTAPVNAVTVGTIAGTNRVHVSQTVVTCTVAIPSGAAPGAQTVTVTFPGPPSDPTQTVSYTLPNGFNITAASPLIATAAVSTDTADTLTTSSTATKTRTVRRRR